jgi:hypothetical protein
MAKLHPFPTSKKIVFPHWTVLGRRYDDYDTALAIAEIMSRKGPVDILRQDDNLSPAFVCKSLEMQS